MPNMLASSTVILRREWVISGRIRPNAYPSSRLHYHFNTGDFGSSESNLIEWSNGRWMLLAPFLVMLLIELAATLGWVNRLVRSLHSIGAKTMLLGVRHLEVVVEVAAERRRPGEAPAIRRLYACSFASGARDTAQSVTS